MTVPDKMFSTYSWEEICVYMFVKRHLANGVLQESYQHVADEFGTTRGRVRHMLERMVSEGLLPIGLRSGAAPSTISTGEAMIRPLDNTNTEDRKRVFYNSLVPYVKTYGKEMVRDFYNYWSETTPSGKKMRFEMQKTWETERRLVRWQSNNSNPKNRDHNPHTDGTILHAGQMDYEKGGW